MVWRLNWALIKIFPPDGKIGLLCTATNQRHNREANSQPFATHALIGAPPRVWLTLGRACYLFHRWCRLLSSRRLLPRRSFTSLLSLLRRLTRSHPKYLHSTP